MSPSRTPSPLAFPLMSNVTAHPDRAAERHPPPGAAVDPHPDQRAEPRAGRRRPRAAQLPAAVAQPGSAATEASAPVG
ncbi:hypothetical protein [Micromonospora sp. NPDC057141]|uniref:hypothetical protein n=1 Tax=Micromonospora sp. NPDC057141 TaxID=3346033 RepID=UPI00363B062C